MAYLVRHTHPNYCHRLSGLQAITNVAYGHCNKLISSALCSNHSIVRIRIILLLRIIVGTLLGIIGGTVISL